MLSFTNFLNHAVTRGLSFKAAKRAFQGLIFLDLYLAHLIPSLYCLRYCVIIQQRIFPVKPKQHFVYHFSEINQKDRLFLAREPLKVNNLFIFSYAVCHNPPVYFRCIRKARLRLGFSIPASLKW